MRHRSVERAILEGIRNEAEELDKVVPETPDDTGRGFAPDANMTIKDGDDLPPEPEERGGLPEAVVEIMAAGKARQAGLKAEDVDQGELEMGLEVEKEHTDDPRVAEMIALDHLAEIPDYYTRLKRMEDEAKAEMGKKGPPKPEEPEDDDEEDEGPDDDEGLGEGLELKPGKGFKGGKGGGKYAAWKKEVDDLCKKRTGCSWNDLAGDEPTLKNSYENGQSPADFVQWQMDKYDLDDISGGW